MTALEKDPNKRSDMEGLLSHPFLCFNLKDALSCLKTELEIEKTGVLGAGKYGVKPPLIVIGGSRKE